MRLVSIVVLAGSLVTVVPQIAAMPCEKELNGELSIEAAVKVLKEASGRFGQDYIAQLRHLAGRVANNQLSPTEGIPIEFYDALLAISKLELQNQTNNFLNRLTTLFIGNFRRRQSPPDRILNNHFREVSEIHEILQASQENLQVLARTPRVVELNNY